MCFCFVLLSISPSPPTFEQKVRILCWYVAKVLSATNKQLALHIFAPGPTPEFI